MQRLLPSRSVSIAHKSKLLPKISLRLARPFFLSGMLVLALFFSRSLSAQVIDRAASTNAAEVKTLANHHPQWANPANDAGLLPADRALDSITIVLTRSPQQEAAFQQFLADQQDPASPSYHRWLTPAQIAQRFGPSEAQTSAVARWLQSQGLHVGWIAPSRAFIGFGGTAAQVGSAFQTEMHSYRVNGIERISVSSDPILPAALAPSVKSIRGLFTVEDQPLHSARTMSSDVPEVTFNRSHYLAPADFTAIYDVSSGSAGAGQTIGIVGRSRTDSADFDNFRQITHATFADPTEVVPTAFGGVDPGPPLTAPPSSTTNTGDQLEATLDVLRAGSVAPAANLLLVVATSASGGIDADAQYLVNTSPLPAQIMNISFGACESGVGSAGVAYWDSLFQQAAMEGISVFVSSGDSGASGCDIAFAAPPVSPAPNSPNYICSSSYATCVGGTEFNDTTDPSQYWSSTNQPNLQSALGYIPEGAWNEPLTTTSTPQASASGGGVSSFIPTPSWQTGTGVPAARTGRYTPDLAFSASAHDGYFACFAAAGAPCVSAANGSYQFEYLFGTSAAAPSMAAITALLNEKLGSAQGNLNPQLYTMAASSPSSFHDVTVASSGVANCQLAIPSMCNNSAPSATALTGGQPGYAITAGYDEVTGLGSLDVANFLNSYLPAKSTPTVAMNLPASITTAQPLNVFVQVTGATSIVPTGSMTLSSGSYSSAPLALGNGQASFNLPAGTLPAGNDTLTATYSPDAASAPVYSTATTSSAIQVTAIAKITPIVYAQATGANITTAQMLQVLVSIDTPLGDQAATGTVKLSSGTYASAPVSLFGGSTYLTVPAQVLSVGTDTLTISYTPDTASASIYNSATGQTSVIVTAAIPTAPLMAMTLTPTTITTAQALSIAVGVGGAFGNPAGTGTVTLNSGSYSSAPATLSNGSCTFNIPAGTLPIGNDSITANYTPDAGSSAIYTAASSSVQVTVSAPPPPAFAITATAVTLLPGANTANTSTITVTPSNGFTGSVTLSAAITSSPASGQDTPTLNFGTTGAVDITGASAGTAALVITTSAPSTSASAHPSGSAVPWYAAVSVSLAGLLLFGMPARRLDWRRTLGLLLLLVAFAGTAIACGSGSKTTTGPTQPANPGTTAGNYTVTITGTSGSTTVTTPFTLTVQ